jgi:hypothetical protein
MRFAETCRKPGLFTSPPKPNNLILNGSFRATTVWSLVERLRDYQKIYCMTIGRVVSTIPMLNSKVRSLNLANAVAIVLYDALRQTGSFAPPSDQRVLRR